MRRETDQIQAGQRQARSSPLWIAVAILLAAGCAAPGSTWPNESWPTSTPEEQAMDSGQLEAMMAYVDEHDIPIDSVVVVRHGQILFERYGPGYSPDMSHALHSVTKSVTSMLAGIAVDQGAIKGVDVPIAELLPGYTSANPDPRRDQITLEHLLTMSSGIDWLEHEYPYEDPRNPAAQAGQSSDMVQFMLDRPMAYTPGEVWAYNSGGSAMLGAIVEEATGRDLATFAREFLFDPIGIGPVYWEHMADGHYAAGGGLHMTPRDMARLGYLMLHRGKWDGQQILSGGWVARSTQSYHQADGPAGYGYQWWILPEEQGFAAMGRWQQRIYVLPAADMVVVFTADIRESSLYSVDRLLYTFVLPACTDLPAQMSAKTYDAHGVTFTYPAGFLLEEAAIPGHSAVSDSRGMVQISSTWEPMEIVLVLWHVAEPDEDAGSFLDAYLAGLEELGEMKLTPGELRAGQKDGHAMAVRFSEAVLAEATLPVVSGAWICDASGRGFAVTYLTAQAMAPDDLLATMEQYLAGLACH